MFRTLNIVANMLEFPPELCLESAYPRTHFSLNTSLGRPERGLSGEEQVLPSEDSSSIPGIPFPSASNSLVVASTGALARTHKHTLTHFDT